MSGNHAAVHAGLWPTLRHDQAGSMTARPGGLDGALDDDDSRHVGALHGDGCVRYATALSFIV